MEYAGFWRRVGASMIDTILLLLLVAPLLTLVYGQSYWSDAAAVSGFWNSVINYLLPVIAVLAFWFYKSATPGKMVLKISIVDAKTGGKPSFGQLIGRYLAYYVSAIPFCLGFVWVGIDKRKQGWHDKLAGTVVVRNASIKPDEFES